MDVIDREGFDEEWLRLSIENRPSLRGSDVCINADERLNWPTRLNAWAMEWTMALELASETFIQRFTEIIDTCLGHINEHQNR